VSNSSTFRGSMDTPFSMDAAFDVSSSTSILIFEMDVLVVPDKLDPVDMDRSVLTFGPMRSCSTSSNFRLSGLGLRSTAWVSATIFSTTWIDSPADLGFLCFKAEKWPAKSESNFRC